MKCLSAVLVVAGTTLATRDLAAQATPGRAPKPAPAVASTFDAVHDSRHAIGASVQFPVILLPETAIQNTSGGKTTYYVLAVHKGGPYATSIGPLLAELKDKGVAMMREIPTVVGDDKRYKELIGGLDGLLKRAFDLKPTPEETVAVEVPGLAAVASAYNWETVEEPRPWLTALNAFTPYRGELFSIDAAAVRRDIINMALVVPPNLEQELPAMNLSPLFRFTSQADLDNFNAAVELYNAELQRRRRYVVERTEADFQLALDRLDFQLGQAEETLMATVIAAPALANKTFSRIYEGKTPPAFVRERGKPEASLARRALAATAVQICSYPTGATVRMGGREVGVTPYIARGLPAASKLEVALSKTGVPAHEAVETVPVRPSGAKRFDYTLVSAKPRLLSAEEGKRLFDPGFKPAQPFTLAITSAPPPAPPPRGTKESKEQRQNREFDARHYTEYVDAIRKAPGDPASSVASWFHLVDEKEADVVVEIVAIQPSERRSKTDSRSTHRVSVRMANATSGDVLVEDISPWSAKPASPLQAAVARLKNERWQRALGVDQ